MRRILAGLFFISLLALGVAAGHYYLAQRLIFEPGFSPGVTRGLSVLLIGLALTLIVEPIAPRVLRPRYARILVWPSVIWMGFAFIAVIALGASDGLLWMLGATGSGDPASVSRVRAALVVGVAFSVGLTALRSGLAPPRLRRVELRLPRWPKALDGFRIVQISDIHIGPVLGKEFAASIVKRVNALEPDLIAVTGDLVDGGVEPLRDEVEPFARLEAPQGVFFVTGNHDYLSGADPWVARARELGMHVLRNQRVRLGDEPAAFDLAGVEDHHARYLGGDPGEDLHAALDGRDHGRALILLAHDPSTFKQARRMGIDLQLSGHTHGGQIWPFNYVVRLVIPYVAGHYRDGDAQLYVSRGTGFWGPPMRLFAPAEITELMLYSEAAP